MTTPAPPSAPAGPTILVSNSVSEVQCLTAVLKAAEGQVRKFCRIFLPGARIVAKGRFVAVQHPKLDAHGREGIYDLAVAHNLPLIEVRRGKPIA